MKFLGNLIRWWIVLVWIGLIVLFYFAKRG